MPENNLFEIPVDPRTIQSKIDSPEGQVFKTMLIQYGREIAEQEYELQKTKACDWHCRMRFQEFLGTPMTDEQREEYEKVDEWIKTFEGQNNIKEGENDKCL